LSLFFRSTTDLPTKTALDFFSRAASKCQSPEPIMMIGWVFYERIISNKTGNFDTKLVNFTAPKWQSSPCSTPSF